MSLECSAFQRWLSVVMLLVVAGHVSADEAREKVRARLLSQMEKLAAATKVEFASGERETRFVDKPVFRYDDQPRKFIDATMWVWTHAGRPIAFEKVEAMEDIDTGAPKWGYCFTSFSEDNLRTIWGSGRRYESTERGATFAVVPGMPEAGMRNSERKRQARELARRFSARILIDPRTNKTEEMRLLTTPIFEYEAEKGQFGAVFGYSTNGTNPDLLIDFEARKSGDKFVWHYAAARMTTGGLTVKYEGAKVWEVMFSEPGVSEYPNWTSFQTPRTVEESE